MDVRERVLFDAAIRYFAGDAKRVQHFTKVYTYAAMIAAGENIPAPQAAIVRAAAIVHDVGIKPAEAQLGRCDGKLQEQFGPAEAKKLLASAGYSTEESERVCYLVGHHHTYTGMQGADYHILVEADFLVNFYEDGVSPSGISAAVQKIFSTRTGKALAAAMYPAAFA